MRRASSFSRRFSLFSEEAFVCPKGSCCSAKPTSQFPRARALHPQPCSFITCEKFLCVVSFGLFVLGAHYVYSPVEATDRLRLCCESGGVGGSMSAYPNTALN